MTLDTVGQLGNNKYDLNYDFLHVMDDVTDVAAGFGITLILRKDGSVWACGFTQSGGFGNGVKYMRTDEPIKIFENAVAVASGNDNSYVIKNDGSLWGCGTNSWGTLGDGTYNSHLQFTKMMDSVKSVSASMRHILVIKRDGTLWACGGGKINGRGFKKTYGVLGDGTWIPRNKFVKVMTGVRFASAGYYHSMVITDDNSLWGFGWNGTADIM